MITTINEFRSLNENHDNDLLPDDADHVLLEKLCKQNGWNVKLTKIIGGGGNGMVAMTNIGDVVKITTDYTEYQLSEMWTEARLEHFVPMTDGKPIRFKSTRSKNERGWLIRRPYAEPMKKQMAKILDTLPGFHLTNAVIKKMPNTWLRDQLLSIIHELKKLGCNDIGDTDINSYNMGILNDKLVVFDMVFEVY